MQQRKRGAGVLCAKDTSFAVSVVGLGHARAAPYLFDQSSKLRGVALRNAARGRRRRRSNNSATLANVRLDLAQRRQRNSSGVRQGEQLPLHPGGTTQLTAIHADRVQQRVFVRDVVIVAGQHMRGIVGFQANEIRHVVAVEVQHVVHRRSLLHEELHTVEVREERATRVPPRDLGVEMCACKVLLPGQACGRG